MKKFLIFLSIALFLGAMWFTYDKWEKNARLSAWSFIPANSILVYESNEPLRSFADIEQTDVWANLSYVPGFRDISSSKRLLDSLSPSGSIDDLFKGTDMLAALNNTGSSTFDFVYVVNLKNLSRQTFVGKAEQYFQLAGSRRKTRVYNGITITEITNGQQAFSFMIYKQYFVGSFSGFLVEDAIRTVEDPKKLGFLSNHPELIPLTKLTKDQGNVYLNGNKIGDVVKLFNKRPPAINFAKSSFLDLKAENDFINLSGFTFAKEKGQYLNLFKNIESGGFDIIEIIPNNTSWFCHFSAKKPTMLGQAFLDYYGQNSPGALSLQKKTLGQHNFDINYTYRLIDDEMALLNLEGTSRKLLILEVKDMDETLRFFKSPGEGNPAKRSDSVYAGHVIRQLPVKGYPYALLGELGKGFEEAYYLSFRNYLVMSNFRQELKNFLDAVTNEDTWPKSINVSNFLQLTNSESCFSLFVNTPRAWKEMTDNMKPEWKDFFLKEKSTFRRLEFAAFQFSAIDDKFYTNVTLFQPNFHKKAIPEKIKTLNSISLPAPILSKPWIMENQNKQREILVQDSSRQLYLVGAGFSVLWNVNIREPIIGKPIQLDYFKNGKSQYAFATESAIHLIDNAGQYVPEFPKSLSGVKIKDFNVIDYDNSKKYRFAIIDKTGKVFLTDKNVKPLDGWNPKQFDSPLSHAPIHKRISGRDIFIVSEHSGKVWMLNRRGRPIAGYPVDLASKQVNKPNIRLGNKLEDASVTILSENGELFEYSFTGKLLGRRQLYKPSVESKFEIVHNIAGEDFKLARRAGGALEILDTSGTALFSKDFHAPGQLHIQYYNLGGGQEFMAVTDPFSSRLYFYGMDGNLLTENPLPGTNPVSLLQFGSEYKVYRAVGNTLEALQLSFD